MSKEEQIALELTKLWYSSIEDVVFDMQMHLDELWNTYDHLLKKLKEEKKEESNIEKMQDEIGTYRYILDSIKQLMDGDYNNYVLKEDLERVMVGVGNDTD